MADSAFRSAIEFFNNLGIYDVVLPFLLVFTIVFAILERTKIFGVEKIGGQEYPRKNLNSMASFVIALLTIASTQIVKVINQSLSQIVLLLIISVSFLILIGSFFGREEEVKLTGAWRAWGMAVLGAGVLLIFANQVGWVQPAWTYIIDNINSGIVGSIFLVVLILIFMIFVTRQEPKAEKKEGGK